MTPTILTLCAALALCGIVLCVLSNRFKRSARCLAAAARADLHTAATFRRDAIAMLAAHPDPMVVQRERVRRGTVGRDSRGRFIPTLDRAR